MVPVLGLVEVVGGARRDRLQSDALKTEGFPAEQGHVTGLEGEPDIHSSCVHDGEQ